MMSASAAIHLIESRGDKVPKEWKDVAGYFKADRELI
jgi:hypothetical protein